MITPRVCQAKPVGTVKMYDKVYVLNYDHQIVVVKSKAQKI